MDIYTVAMGVAIGNMLSVSMFYGFREMLNHSPGGSVPWWSLGAFILPIVFILLALANQT